MMPQENCAPASSHGQLSAGVEQGGGAETSPVEGPPPSWSPSGGGCAASLQPASVPPSTATAITAIEAARRPRSLLTQIARFIFCRKGYNDTDAPNLKALSPKTDPSRFKDRRRKSVSARPGPSEYL